MADLDHEPQTDDVVFDVEGGVGVITLNRPKALNALTLDMCLAMQALLKDWATDDAIKAVIIEGAGEKGFCAGGDIRALHDSGKGDGAYARDFYFHEYRVNRAIKHFPKPYVALIDGITMGGGVGVSVHGSHRVAGDRSVFAMPETGIGLFPDVGGSHFLPRLPRNFGFFFGLTGARIKAADMVYSGVATHYVPSDKQPGIFEAMKAGASADEAVMAVAEEPGTAPLGEAAQAIEQIFSARTMDALVEALKADGSDFAHQTLATLETKSPTSLKLTMRQLAQGEAEEDFDATMKMEYRLARRVIEGHDFYEGVRAVIIDKDNAPQWKPARLDQVSDADIEGYFASLGDEELTF